MMSGPGAGWNPHHGWGAPQGQPPSDPQGSYSPPPTPAYGAYPSPPQGQQWGQPLPPSPPRRPTHKVLFGAVAGIVIVVAGGVGAYVMFGSGTSSSNAGAGTSAAVPTTALSAATVRVVPTTVLPTDQQVQQATLLNLAKKGDVDTAVYPDQTTDPASCTLVDNTDTATIAGQAISMASAVYTDKPGDDYNYSAYVSLAVFDTNDAAAAALPKIINAVKGCTVPYTIPSNNKPGKPAKPWTISDVKAQGNQIAWLNTQQSTGTPWKCGKAFRAEANVTVTATLCHQNPSMGPSKLIDAVITNVNGKK
ncbi:sensor domain-containing protein [Mycolicibacterium llatzerense]|uniref:sensor domain-containing protein n=2 Tax=Mycolicibacterium llatzerense TaxID=280871 RepID=UPI0031CFEAD6